MIREMSLNVEEAMRARKFPVRLEYGPPYPAPEVASNGLIVIERDTDSDDVAQPKRQASQNPQQRAVRIVACRATVYAQSSKGGALRSEHEHECEVLVDGLHTALSVWCEAAQTGQDVQWGGGRYAKPGDLNFAERFNGVQYTFKFGIARGVYLVDYEGLAQPSMAPKGTGGVVNISANGDGPARVVTLPTS